MSESHSLKLKGCSLIVGLLIVALSVFMTITAPTEAAASRSSSLSAGAMHVNHGRAVAANGTVHGCPYYYFCAYSGQGFTGQKIEMYYCQYYGMPFGGIGSFVNNQTPGTVAKGYGQNYNYIWNSGRAFSQDNVMEWMQIWYVKPC